MTELALTGMDAIPLRGADLASSLREKITDSVIELTVRGGAPPVLVTVLVGTNASAEAYRASIRRTLRTVPIEHHSINLPVETTKSRFIDTLTGLNRDPLVTGVMVLMPLPEHIGHDAVLEVLSPLKDVDGITPTNAGRMHLGLPSLKPSTPQGGIELLDHYDIPIAGSRIAVIG
nr:bifunctional 5,10-methylenetetrahydrofolate dehydrogenase/5,10-methenyltetrahydrofolate cyclohydrolase [Chloroflexota bacterium]